MVSYWSVWVASAHLRCVDPAFEKGRDHLPNVFPASSAHAKYEHLMFSSHQLSPVFEDPSTRAREIEPHRNRCRRSRAYGFRSDTAARHVRRGQDVEQPRVCSENFANLLACSIPPSTVPLAPREASIHHSKLARVTYRTKVPPSPIRAKRNYRLRIPEPESTVKPSPGYFQVQQAMCFCNSRSLIE